MFEKISPQEIISLAASITFRLTKGKSIDEINALKNLIGIIHSNLNTYVSQYLINCKFNNCDDKNNSNNNKKDNC